MEPVSVLIALAGGLLIGGAASALLFYNGRIAGISNIVAGLIAGRSSEGPWRLAFVLGLVTGGGILALAAPSAFGTPPGRSLPVMAVAGVLVGLGARISNGCTSGHGVCGLARRSSRALAATATFMTAGILTVYVMEHLLPGFTR